MVYKILVVDDEPNMLALLKRVLCKEGYQIECAESGKAALELAGQSPLSLAIVDASMPEMDGIDLLGKLKELNRQMPVIVITAFPSWEREQMARSQGCTHYLSKPLMIGQLKDLIRIILAE
jgi:two-component system NtrC family response regulator